MEKKEISKPVNSFSQKLKRWFFGIGKEFRRIQWIKFPTLVEQLIIVIIILAFLVGLFFLIDTIFITGGIV